jgi:penicillin-binding protein 2
METLLASGRQSWLTWFVRGIIFLGSLILFARLVELQVVKGNYYRLLADENRIRRIPIAAPRGRILARGGEELAGNREVKKRLVFDSEGLKKLLDILDAPNEEIITEYERDYRLGSDFAHVSGYLGEVNEDELNKVKPECIDKGARKVGDLVGRGGLEETFDCKLRGIDGEELVEVDSMGRVVRLLGRRNPQAGEDVVTHINFGLQEFIAETVEEAKKKLGFQKAAVVVTDPGGEVLALYSTPSFNPNFFIKKDKEKIDRILNDPNLALFNRVTSGLFHPGSVFKPLVAIAALEEKKIDSNFRFDDTGVIEIESIYGRYSYKNWYFTQYGGKEGEIGVVKAIARSTDTFFYKVGELLGIDSLVLWSQKFGLDKRTGIELTAEVAGLVPSPQWKLETKKERWFLGNTYHMAIGQGDLAVTPIELNTMISAIANKGKLCNPRLVGEPVCKDLGIGMDSIGLVKEGMVAACSPGGTGFTFFDFKEKKGVVVACKTGTAETNDVDNTTHAWFTAFAPADNPEIVLTVMVEKGGEGSKVAGPIARTIMDYWFGNRK